MAADGTTGWLEVAPKIVLAGYSDQSWVRPTYKSRSVIKLRTGKSDATRGRTMKRFTHSATALAALVALVAALGAPAKWG